MCITPRRTVRTTTTAIEQDPETRDSPDQTESTHPDRLKVDITGGNLKDLSSSENRRPNQIVTHSEGSSRLSAGSLGITIFNIKEEVRRTVPKMESLTKSAILDVYVDVVRKVGI